LKFSYSKLQENHGYLEDSRTRGRGLIAVKIINPPCMKGV